MCCSCRVCVCREYFSLSVCVCDLFTFYPFQVQEGARKEAQLKREVERKDAGLTPCTRYCPYQYCMLNGNTVERGEHIILRNIVGSIEGGARPAKKRGVLKEQYRFVHKKRRHKRISCRGQI